MVPDGGITVVVFTTHPMFPLAFGLYVNLACGGFRTRRSSFPQGVKHPLGKPAHVSRRYSPFGPMSTSTFQMRLYDGAKPAHFDDLMLSKRTGCFLFRHPVCDEEPHQSYSPLSCDRGRRLRAALISPGSKGVAALYAAARVFCFAGGGSVHSPATLGL